MSAAAIAERADEMTVEAALKEAHIPSLMMALVHLTGDASHLTDANKPTYDFFGDGQGAIKPEVQEEIRAKVAQAWREYAAGKSLPPPPSNDTIRRMMDF